MTDKANKGKKKGLSLADLIESITPLQQAQTDSKMIIAAKIADGIANKGWNRGQFLKAMNKDTPSVLTKWLSGTHNFTIDTLVEIERVLDIKLLNTDKAETVTVNRFHVVLSGEDSSERKMNLWPSPAKKSKTTTVGAESSSSWSLTQHT